MLRNGFCTSHVDSPKSAFWTLGVYSAAPAAGDSAAEPAAGLLLHDGANMGSIRLPAIPPRSGPAIRPYCGETVKKLWNAGGSDVERPDRGE
ncbi:hypothetical protein AHIS1636_09780 [Arthrobacter mangrovi]|uniref:Uncharacterized protein n=1 Tax=Arthrobacter mangrovi TaxID=2966350 RepID=A0ABQ5MRE5_9MICC|nr:hypothetical protein AHIS1636_09780 [Arthrobacter mangrovi]